jgi:hypothetical protein
MIFHAHIVYSPGMNNRPVGVIISETQSHLINIIIIIITTTTTTTTTITILIRLTVLTGSWPVRVLSFFSFLITVLM